jgi:hypothetical protein
MEFQIQQKPLEQEVNPDAKTPSTISKEDSMDSVIGKPVLKEMELVLVRDGGQPFGLNIAGGLGSSPFVDNDQSIFISKVVPGGLADVTGLQVSSKII